jgi:hypothetical protein
MKKSELDFSLQTWVLMNHPAHYEWFDKKARSKPEDIFLLTQDNRETFTRVFGKRHGVFRGSHFFSVWDIEFRGYTFRVFTAKDHGTSYEIVTNLSLPKFRKDEKIGKICVAFLDDVAKKIKAK